MQRVGSWESHLADSRTTLSALALAVLLSASTPAAQAERTPPADLPPHRPTAPETTPPRKIREYDKEIVRRQIRKAVPAFAACWVKPWPGAHLTGRMVVKFDIGKSGRVEALAVMRSTLNSPALEKCLSAVFSSMSFPAPPEVVHVTYPLQVKIDAP